MGIQCFFQWGEFVEAGQFFLSFFFAFLFGVMHRTLILNCLRVAMS